MEQLKALVISQARMTSSRLPGKVLLEIAGKPLIQYQLERISRTGLDLVVATTDLKTDDRLCEFLEHYGVPVFRGSEQNVLSRYYHCAKQHQAQIIVRVTSDCPLVDGQIIKQAIDQYQAFANPRLYLSNVVKRSFPRGFDFEVFSFEMLEAAYLNAKSQSDLEHVTPYIRANIPRLFANFDVLFSSDKSHFRITVDEPRDFELMKILIERFHCNLLSADRIIEILEQNQELALINQEVVQKKLP